MTAVIVCIVITGTVLWMCLPNRNQIYDRGFSAGVKKGAQNARRELKEEAEGQRTDWAEKLLSAGFEAGIAYAESGELPNHEDLIRSIE